MKRFKLILVLVLGFLVLLAGTMAIAAWTGGMTVGLMGNAEQVTILKIEFNSNNSATLAVSNTGYSTVKINSAYVSGQNAILDSCEAPSGIPKGYSANYIITLLNSSRFIPNEEYTFKLITAKGTSLVNYASFDPTMITPAPNHTHSLNPIIVPNPLDSTYPFAHTRESLFGLGVQQTAILVWSVAATIYAVTAISLVLIDKKRNVPKEIRLLFLVDGNIFLLLPLFWLNGISFANIWAHSIMLLLLGLLGYSAYHIGRLRQNGRGDRAGTFTLFLAITVVLSFIVVFWATSEPMTIGLMCYLLP